MLGWVVDFLSLDRYKFRRSVSVCMLSRSVVRLLAAAWTVACQSPQPMEFSTQESWSGLTFASPGDLARPGIEPMSLVLTGGFFTICAIWETPLRAILVGEK